MKHRFMLGLLGMSALALSSPLQAQGLRHMRVQAQNAPSLATALEYEGYDVVEGSIQSTEFEMVVSDASLLQLEERGLALELIAVSRPYREIQEELNAQAGTEAIPAGYSDLNGIYAQMMAAASNFPAICEFVDVTAMLGTPKTFEGRSLFAIRISDNVSVDEDEPAFMMVGAHHVREIVTPVICIDAINRLTMNYGTDPQITAMVDNNEIWIAPVWNPDGYEFMYNVNNFWRKNRRVFSNGVGVDTNRNYTFGWTSGCAGSTNPGSDTYKGPSPLSEASPATMAALTKSRHFAKVLDFHSSGREVLWEYGCLNHPFASFMQQEAITLSTQSSYNGKNRPPSANGEHYEYQIAKTGAHSFLTETHTSFQPTFASAQNEANRVWPGTIWLLEREIPVSGTVTDAGSGQQMAVNITFSGITFNNGETITSGGAKGRYHVFAPAGNYTLNFASPGYATQSHNVAITATGGIDLDVALVPLGNCGTATATTRNGAGVNPVCLSSVTLPIIGSRYEMAVDASSSPIPVTTLIQGRRQGIPGQMLVFGELFLDLASPLVFQTVVPTNGGIALHGVDVPPRLELVGVTLTVQGAIQVGGLFSALCNAEDIVIGCGP